MSDDNVTSLGARRAEKTADCREWTPLEALRELIAQIESGEANVDMLYIACYGDNPTGGVDYLYKAAGGTKIELIGLLARHLHMTNDGHTVK